MKFYIGTSFKNVEVMNKLSDELQSFGWVHTFDWSEELLEEETVSDFIRFSLLEKKAIQESDIVIILLPGGRGTHVEIGLALASEKEIYLWSEDGKDFDLKDSVNFYYDPKINRVTGDLDRLVSLLSTLSDKKRKLEKGI